MSECLCCAELYFNVVGGVIMYGCRSIIVGVSWMLLEGLCCAVMLCGYVVRLLECHWRSYSLGC